jgi:methylmalonyl-CoA mutase
MSEKLFADFPPVSTADWEAAIAKDLKGRDPKTLVWKTEDGIDVKPYYRAEDLAGIALPESSVTGRAWHIGCEVLDREALQRALDRGAQAVIVPVALAPEVPAGEVAVHVNVAATGGPALSAHATGSFSVDPVNDFTAAEALAHYNAARAGYPRMAPFVVDVARFHNAAATATQELAFAIATGADCLAELSNRGVAPDDLAGHIIFSFAIGSNYFFEIAKLRAAGILWRQIVRAFDAAAAGDIRIHAHTSRWNKTVYDPHVNLLRTTTEAMSAILGGCEMLNVGAFDEAWKTPDEFSRRLAINTQLILRDEAYFGRSGDPAAGSWYIESLTDQMARAAWKIFQDVEVVGGMRAALASGFIEQTIGANHAKRAAAVATRKRSFVGVNQYPNGNEVAPADVIENGLANSRGAYPFEAIRLATDRHSIKTGVRPAVFLVRIGDVKMRRARADFAANYFACGGFAITDSKGFESAEDAIAAIAKSDAALVVLCSSDAEYAALTAAICARVKQPVIVAGYPKELVDTLRGNGAADFVYLGNDAVEVLARWQKNLGMVSQ